MERSTKNYVVTKTLSAGEWLFHEGDPGDCAYLVEQGEILIVLEREDEIIPLGLYGEGSLFGEIAIIGDQPRSAGALAHTDCRLRKISREQLNRRLDQADPILKLCISVLIDHLKKSLNQYEQQDPDRGLSLDEKLQRAADAAVQATRFDVSGLPKSQVQTKASKSDLPLRIASLTKASPVPRQLFELALRTINLENDINDALHQGELTLFYQPIIEARTGGLAGFEALMRWIHPERGLIAPSEFIPVAERSGQLLAMTHWAVERACSDLVTLRDQLLSSLSLSSHVSERLFMSVNFSSRDFLDGKLMEKVQQLLQVYDLPRNSLKIEVTESVLMSSPVQVREVLDQCRNQGASIAIDDFGTGYSSLSYLQTLPADTLKIDQAFIRPMHNDERHLALVESIIHLAQRLNMVTVAEGVENEDDVNALSRLQCDYLQGYYFGRPMPLSEVLDWATKRWGDDEVVFLG